ncbi:MAG TPA: ATP-dependent 6-phosphofructokinase [Actinomycetota bacterium]|nr:ATP-dependent 6-phosphofructokinase [Actinomycetota bacterium]
MARFGVLTGGGDCPGLNAVIRAVTRRGHEDHGHRIVGFRNGYRGVLEGSVMELTPRSARGILHRGGTILGTSRADPFRLEGGLDLLRENLETYRIDGLIVIGGEGTLGSAAKLSAEGINVVGVPKTIDNDIAATDFTFGFDTAVQVATDAIDRLHTTAESHNRVMVLEVMGRHTGWIGLYAGLAGGADVILIPEHPFDINDVCSHLLHRSHEGHTFSIVVVSEGATPREGTLERPSYETDEFGRPKLGGISSVIAAEIERRTGFETRVTILGHVQRGGSPTAADRVLATRFGVAAIDLASDGRWGRMVALRGGDIVDCQLDEAVGELKRVPDELYGVAEVFFG